MKLILAAEASVLLFLNLIQGEICCEIDIKEIEIPENTNPQDHIPWEEEARANNRKNFR